MQDVELLHRCVIQTDEDKHGSLGGGRRNRSTAAVFRAMI
jgi:hypothetical protein